jgi:hypothetical protein
MSNEDTEIPAVKGWIGSLGKIPNMPALPDPDWLWMRAQISARHAVAARALRSSTLHRALHAGILGAGVVWLLLECIGWEGSELNWSTRVLTSISAEPAAGVAICALAALGIALLSGMLVLGRAPLARRLRYFGLL